MPVQQNPDHPNTKLFYCYNCPKKFSTLTNVKFHLVHDHFVVEQKGRKDIKRTQNRECDKVYDTFKGMMNHSRLCVLKSHYENNQNNYVYFRS